MCIATHMTWRKVLRKCFGSLLLFIASFATAQSNGRLAGKIFDPTGAAIPNAKVMLTSGSRALTTHTNRKGAYLFEAVPAGSYTLVVAAPGFANYSRAKVQVAAGEMSQLNISLVIAVQKRTVTVNGQSPGASVSPEENFSQIVIRGSELNALSDDPQELQDELEALAGPAAGPNGGQIYINGFAGGQLPPKSSIREIRINENPFSAEFSRLGYGRIEIFTKPGTNKFSGHFISGGNDSAWNTSDPFIAHQPGYYLYSLGAGVGGPIGKHTSYMANALRVFQGVNHIVESVDPADTSTTLHVAVPTPTAIENISLRMDRQLGNNNTLTINDDFHRLAESGAGTGELNLPEQAYSIDNLDNSVQLWNSWIVNAHVVNDTRFQWIRDRNRRTPAYFTPAVTVEGAFNTGGSSTGTVEDHQDDFDLQSYYMAAIGAHTLNFGGQLRAYRDANYSNAGTNGSYLFSSINQYLAGMPTQYRQTVTENPLARLTMFDGALFYQDDWRWKPYLTLSYGLRFETQNYIHDHADWAPRLALAWAPGGMKRGRRPKTVIRAGYGWFYDRFSMSGSLGASNGTPYLIQTIHENGLNQQSYVIDHPKFYDPDAPLPPSQLSGVTEAIPSIFTLDPHFHAALNMQAGIGVDRSLGKKVLLNVTYLYTRGVHQYLTNNITAPAFDTSTYSVVGPQPSIYNYQFQSAGVYKQHQVIVTVTTHFRHLMLHGVYTYNHAESDTQGVSYVPSVSRDPAFDYGRAKFGITSRFLLIGSYSAPYGIMIAPVIATQSGTPYNVTIGSNLTGSNQFNARPGYGVCGAPGVVSTPYGCLDTDPTGKGEKIIPYDLGTGPADFSMLLRVIKVIGVGPRIEQRSAGGARIGIGGGSVGQRGLSGSQLRLGSKTASRRRYHLSLIVSARNLLNDVNLSPPNGTLNSPLFGTSQSTASGIYGSPTLGNRAITASAMFNF